MAENEQQELSKLVKKSARKGRGPSLVNRVKKNESSTPTKKFNELIKEIIPQTIEMNYSISSSRSIQSENIEESPKI
jgi:uncharacterized protein YaaR (DUF327 family)